jgi:4-hydroxybenzoate polyprenyltransferase
VLFIAAYCIVIFIGGFPLLLVHVIRGVPDGQYLLQGGFLLTDTQKYSIIFLSISAFFFLIYAFRLNKKQILICLKSIRWERCFYYAGLCLLGFYIGTMLFNDLFPRSFENVFDFVAVAVLAVIGMCAFQGQAVINDFYDSPADSMTRKRNPLVREKSVSRTFYLTWGLVLIALSMLFALCLNFPAFLLITACHVCACIYTMPPLRLKKIPFVSTLVIAFASVLCAIMGMTLYCGEGAFVAFPPKLIGAFLISLTLGFTAKDIHDIKGDRAQHVYTVPVIFGKKATAVLTALSFFVFPLFFGSLLLFVVAACFAVFIIMYSVVLKKSDERIFFFVLMLFGAALIAFFFWNPQVLIVNTGSGYSPNTSVVVFEEGKQMLHKGDLDRGVQKMDSVISMNAFFEDAYYFKALSLIRNGRENEARSTMKQALNLGLNQKRFVYLKGILQLTAGRADASYRSVHKAIRMGHTDDAIWFYWGQLLLRKGSVREAVQAFKQYVIAEPFDSLGALWLRKAEAMVN